MDKIDTALKDVKTAASGWMQEKKTGKINLSLNFSQGSILNWQIGTDETRKE